MKNFKKLSVALMLALGTTFAMTSCGDAAEETATTEEATPEEVVEEVVADSTATCEGGEEAEATCEGGEEVEAAH
jgi:hypothetical protein